MNEIHNKSNTRNHEMSVTHTKNCLIIFPNH